MYTLTLTNEDLDTLGFVGSRYCWSHALLHLECGQNSIPENEAWDIADAFQADTEGGHAPLPLLSPESKLYSKLHSFWNQIV